MFIFKRINFSPTLCSVIILALFFNLSGFKFKNKPTIKEPTLKHSYIGLVAKIKNGTYGLTQDHCEPESTEKKRIIKQGDTIFIAEKNKIKYFIVSHAQTFASNTKYEEFNDAFGGTHGDYYYLLKPIKYNDTTAKLNTTINYKYNFYTTTVYSAFQYKKNQQISIDNKTQDSLFIKYQKKLKLKLITSFKIKSIEHFLVLGNGDSIPYLVYNKNGKIKVLANYLNDGCFSC